MAQVYDPVARLNELTQGTTFAMLTTVRPDGSLHSCPMATRPAGSDGVIWLLSSSDTEKVEAVRTLQRVSLAYADPAQQRYVSVSGFCELVRDHVRIKQLWDGSYTSWCPGGLDDPNLILLKITVNQAEYWDASQCQMVELLGFAGAALE